MSIFQAIVNQTIAGLAQGRRIEGKVLFLGGPLYLLSGPAAALPRDAEALGRGRHVPRIGPLCRGAWARPCSPRARRRPSRLTALREKLATAKVVSGAQDAAAAVCKTRQSTPRLPRRHAPRLRAARGALPPIAAGPIWASTAAAPRRSWRSFPKTRSFSIPTTPPTTAIPWRSCASELGEIYARTQGPRAHPRQRRDRLRRRPHPPRLPCGHRRGGDHRPLHGRRATSARTWTSFSTSAGRTSSASASGTAPSTASCSTRPVPRAAARLSRRLPSPWTWACRNSPQGACSPARPVDLGSRCTVFMNSSVKQAQTRRRHGGGHLRRAFRQRGQKRRLQGHPRRLRRRAGATHVVVQGGTFSQRRRAARL